MDTVVRVVSVPSKVTCLRWMTPPLSAPFISAPLLPAVIWFLVRRRRLLLLCLALWPQFEHNGAHTCPVFGTLTEPHDPFRWCFFHAE